MNRRTFLRNGGLLGGYFLSGTPFRLPTLRGWPHSSVRVERLYFTLGTTIRYLVFHEDEQEGLGAIHDAQALVQEVHRLMSIQEQDSELSRWNRSETGLEAPFHPLTALAIDEAIQYRRLTERRFDPMVGSVAAAGRQNHNSFLGEDHWGDWDVEERRMRKVNAYARLDLGGSAKGWAVDRAVEILTRRGVDAALVNAGGDLRVVGHPPDEASWRIGIRNPMNHDDVFCELNLTDCSVATSGDYETEGSTIIDPRNAEPVSFNGSATVIAPLCGAADCLSTAICVEPDADIKPIGTHWLIARPVADELVVERSPGFPSSHLASEDPGLGFGPSLPNR